MSRPLHQLTHSGIRELQKILDMETDGEDQNFPTVVKAKNAAAATAINAQIKVDENRLRSAIIDRLPELLQIVREEEEKLALLRSA